MGQTQQVGIKWVKPIGEQFFFAEKQSWLLWRLRLRICTDFDQCCHVLNSRALSALQYAS